MNHTYETIPFFLCSISFIAVINIFNPAISRPIYLPENAVRECVASQASQVSGYRLGRDVFKSLFKAVLKYLE